MPKPHLRAVFLRYDQESRAPLVQHESLRQPQQGRCPLSSAQETQDMKAPSHTVAGIDVGGTKKGFHAVALRDEAVVAKLATSTPGHVVAWCRELHVSA